MIHNQHKISYLLLLFTFVCLTGFSESRQTGYLKFESNADTFFVTINSTFKQSTVYCKGDSIELKVGFHRVTVSGFDFPDVSFSVGIAENKTSVFKISVKKENKEIQSDACLINHWQGNVLIQTDSDADIYLADSLIGKGIKNLFLGTGIYNLKLKNKDGFEIDKEIKVDSSKFNFYEVFTRPDKNTLFWISFLPGGGQFYKNEDNKGHFFTGLFSSGLFYFLSVSKSDISNSKRNSLIGLSILGSTLILNYFEGVSEPYYGFRNNNYLNILFPNKIYRK